MVCIIPPSEEVESAIPEIRDEKVRGRTYMILSVVLGMPPRCHVCRVRGHKRKECTACRYCGSTLHTTTEHSVSNARRKGWNEVAGATQVTDFVMEEELKSKEENQGNSSQPGPLTQMCQEGVFDSQGDGVISEGKGEDSEGDKRAQGKEEVSK